MNRSPEADRTRRDALAVLEWIGATAVCAAILITALSWLSDRSAGPSPAAPAPTATGEAPASGAAGAPVDFSLPALAGGQVSPADYRGQVVVLEFWATWCGPCRLQADMLERLRRKPGVDGYQVLAVNLGEDLPTVRSYVERTPFPYPVLLDEQETVGRRFGINALPTILILDPEGRVAFQRVGVTDAPTLQAQIESAKS